MYEPKDSDTQKSIFTLYFLVVVKLEKMKWFECVCERFVY